MEKPGQFGKREAAFKADSKKRPKLSMSVTSRFDWMWM
jgi:hypothetical protein